MDEYLSFKEWHLNSINVSDYDAPEHYYSIQSFLNQNDFLPHDLKPVHKQIVDDLVSDFIGSYCDSQIHNSNSFELFGPLLNTNKYNQSTNLICKTQNPDLMKLWSYVINGRSIVDSGNFQPFSKDYRIGFLDRNECEQLLHFIAPLSDSPGFDSISRAIQSVSVNYNQLVIAIEFCNASNSF